MKNFDDRLIQILLEMENQMVWTQEALEEKRDQIKAEIAAQMPKERETTSLTLQGGIEDGANAWSGGYNEAIQDFSEALQLKGKKE